MSVMSRAPHKATRILAAALLVAVMLISCGEKEKIVEVEVEVPADCPPSLPRDVYALNLDGYVSICWAPNPEEDVRYYDIYRYDPVEDVFFFIGYVEDDYPLEDPWEYCFDDDQAHPEIGPVQNGTQYAYAVVAVDADGHDSTEPYDGYITEWVTATPRYEGLLTLYDAGDYPDLSGFDLENYDGVGYNTADSWNAAETDFYFEIDLDGKLEFIADYPRVNIQDYGFSDYDAYYGFDLVNYAPADGWSPSGRVEVILGHVYFIRIGTGTYNYAKIWIGETTATSVRFYWAYQSDIDNRELAPGPGSGADEDGQIILPAASGNERSILRTGKKIKVRSGRQIPPTLEGNLNAEDNL